MANMITNLVMGEVSYEKNADSDIPATWFWITNKCSIFERVKPLA